MPGLPTAVEPLFEDGAKLLRGAARDILKINDPKGLAPLLSSKEFGLMRGVCPATNNQSKAETTAVFLGAATGHSLIFSQPGTNEDM